MGGKDNTAGNEFDAWMGGGPSVKAGAPLDEPATEPVGEPGGEGKRSAALVGLARKPLVLVPTVLAVVMVGLMLVRGGDDPAAAESQYAAISTMPADAPPAAPDEVAAADYEQMGAAALDPPPAPDPAPDPAPAEEPETAAIAELVPAPEPEVEPESRPSRGDLELRIAALQNDLDRAEQTRAANLRTIRGLRSQVAGLEGKGSYSVVAVLNDGVVVRDSSGSEQVYGLGSRIGE